MQGMRKAAVLPDPGHTSATTGVVINNGQRTGLRNANHVMTSDHRWDGIGLDWGRELIATESNVLQHHRVQASVLELYPSQRERSAVLRGTHIGDGINTSLGFDDDLDAGKTIWSLTKQNESPSRGN